MGKDLRSDWRADKGQRLIFQLAHQCQFAFPRRRYRARL